MVPGYCQYMSTASCVYKVMFMEVLCELVAGILATCRWSPPHWTSRVMGPHFCLLKIYHIHWHTRTHTHTHTHTNIRDHSHIRTCGTVAPDTLYLVCIHTYVIIMSLCMYNNIFTHTYLKCTHTPVHVTHTQMATCAASTFSGTQTIG
jgi:hypothetical protein